MKLYDETYKTIRKYDKSSLIFYEPVTWGVLFKGYYFGTGFSRPPGNDAKTTVLSWHYYCWLLNFVSNPLKNGTYPEFDKIACDKVQLEVSFGAIKLDELTLGGSPSFLTEFGVCAFPTNEKDDESRLNTEECESVLDAADRYFQSWTYWDSIFYYKNSQAEISDLVDVFSRVYPMATNGVPQKMYFNTTSKEFLFSYNLNATTVYQAAYVPTEIFVPNHVYPNGFNVHVSIHLKWLYDATKNKLFILTINSELRNLILNKNYKNDSIECLVVLIRK